MLLLLLQLLLHSYSNENSISKRGVLYSSPGQSRIVLLANFYISHNCRTDQRMTALVSLVDVMEMPGLDEVEEEEIPHPILLVAQH